MKHRLLIAALLFTLWPSRSSGAASAAPVSTLVPRYLFPPDGARDLVPGTAIALRPGGHILGTTVQTDLFAVVGSVSGEHAGRVALSDDRETVVFEPDQPFALGEIVQVSVRPGLRTLPGSLLGGLTWSFSVRAKLAQAQPGSSFLADMEAADGGVPAAAVSSAAAPENVLSPSVAGLPANFPTYTVTVPGPSALSEADPEYVFMAPFPWATQGPSFVSILDRTGMPVYYKQMAPGATVFDFKKQPNGLLTYYDSEIGAFRALDNTYSQVDTFAAANGYPTDAHELLLLPSGHALLMIYDWQQPYDMSQVVPGGLVSATVAGLVIQELDTNMLPVFEWRSWDHFLITDTVVNLTTPVVDYVHGNAIEVDTDGNLLVSSRHLNEITKIDRQSGDIIWRLGGKNNQFTIVNDSGWPFSFQHDIRRLANGHIMLFDNHNAPPFSPVPYSRVVEYALDETEGHRVATLAWEYYDTPYVYSGAMGSARRAEDGDTFIGWGAGTPVAATEITSDSVKTFELELASTHRSYRAFTSTWHATPAWDPTLVVTATTPTTATLTMNWNGATDIAAYQVWGGAEPGASTLVATLPKTAFEDQYTLTMLPGQYCYLRVMPVTRDGSPTRYSNEVYTGVDCRFYSLFPFIGLVSSSAP